MEESSSESWQHEQKILEARFREDAAGGQKMRAVLWYLNARCPLGIVCEGPLKVSLSQSIIAFPSLTPSVVPHGWQPQTCLLRLPALKAFSQFLHSFLTHGKESKPLQSQRCRQGQCVESVDVQFEPSSLSRAVS